MMRKVYNKGYTVSCDGVMRTNFDKKFYVKILKILKDAYRVYFHSKNTIKSLSDAPKGF